MTISLDPYMHRHAPLLDLPAFVARLGWEYIEPSPRADCLTGGAISAAFRSAPARSSAR